MMAYATLDDLLRIGSPARLIDLTDRAVPRTGGIDESITALALADASALADSYLAGRYALPLNPVPEALRRQVAMIAYHSLHMDEAPEFVVENFRLALAWLDKVAAGRVVLSAAGVTPVAPGAGGTRVTAREPQFGGGRLGVWAGGGGAPVRGQREEVPASPATDYTSTAGEVIAVGQPITFDGAGRAVPARADARGTATVVGVAISDASQGRIVRWRDRGRVERNDWAAVTADGAAVLETGGNYFLSATAAGRITRTPPQDGGQFVVFIGTAASATVLAVDPAKPIAL